MEASVNASASGAAATSRSVLHAIGLQCGVYEAIFHALCRLAADETVQEALTDDLLAMAAQLKRTAEAQSAALHSRDTALGSAAAGLLKSSNAVTRRVKDTRRAVRRSSRSIFFQIFLLLAVAGIFLGTCLHLPICHVAPCWLLPVLLAQRALQLLTQACAAVAVAKLVSACSSYHRHRALGLQTSMQLASGRL
jgi:hypothetical protein